MQLYELKQMVDSTADAAFAIDGAGMIVSWNTAAEALFGVSVKEALGLSCGQILQGADECGPVCHPDCSIKQAVRCRQHINNFDLQVQTAQGQKWCNVSTLQANIDNSSLPYAIHIIRTIDTRKRLEILVRDFIVTETKLPSEEVKTLVSSTRAPAREVKLTSREQEVLRLIANGATTETIAEQLHISRTTVNNHIQHILSKLNAHTRLEAIRRAEHAGLI